MAAEAICFVRLQLELEDRSQLERASATRTVHAGTGTCGTGYTSEGGAGDRVRRIGELRCVGELEDVHTNVQRGAFHRQAEGLKDGGIVLEQARTCERIASRVTHRHTIDDRAGNRGGSCCGVARATVWLREGCGIEPVSVVTDALQLLKRSDQIGILLPATGIDRASVRRNVERCTAVEQDDTRDLPAADRLSEEASVGPLLTLAQR